MMGNARSALVKQPTVCDVLFPIFSKYTLSMIVIGLTQAASLLLTNDVSLSSRHKCLRLSDAPGTALRCSMSPPSLSSEGNANSASPNLQRRSDRKPRRNTRRGERLASCPACASRLLFSCGLDGFPLSETRCNHTRLLSDFSTRFHRLL